MPTTLITDWNSRWRLDAEKVTCRGCHAEQSEQCKDQPFSHADSCRNEQHWCPWLKLEAALKAAGR